jgi:hypothetical protein
LGFGIYGPYVDGVTLTCIIEYRCYHALCIYHEAVGTDKINLCLGAEDYDLQPVLGNVLYRMGMAVTEFRFCFFRRRDGLPGWRF